MVGLDVDPRIPQPRNITVDNLAVCIDSEAFQMGDYLRHSEAVEFVGLAIEELQ